MAGDTTPNYQPYLWSRDDGITWHVRVKEAAGQFYIMTDDMPKRMAARQMRRIRAAMVRLWISSPEPVKEQVLRGMPVNL